MCALPDRARYQWASAPASWTLVPYGFQLPRCSIADILRFTGPLHAWRIVEDDPAVVDDDMDIRHAVGRSLRSYGHEVHLFESGEAYLANNFDADCAIVDIGLPGVSGLEMEERMRRSGRNIPVVFITAHDDLARRAAQKTPMPVLKKPIDESDLFDAIAQVTGARGT
jgi:CheY-like chemotaxis protein